MNTNIPYPTSQEVFDHVLDTEEKEAEELAREEKTNTAFDVSVTGETK